MYCVHASTSGVFTRAAFALNMDTCKKDRLWMAVSGTCFFVQRAEAVEYDETALLQVIGHAFMRHSNFKALKSVKTTPHNAFFFSILTFTLH